MILHLPDAYSDLRAVGNASRVTGISNSSRCRSTVKMIVSPTRAPKMERLACCVSRTGRRPALVLFAILVAMIPIYATVRAYFLGGVAFPPKPYVMPPTDPEFVRYVVDKSCYYLLGEFLLVPYVGACIHTPPPPPNQIVHVRTEEAYTTDGGLYTPVWVNGLMKTEQSQSNLNFVDGSAGIPSSYALEAVSVEPYE